MELNVFGYFVLPFLFVILYKCNHTVKYFVKCIFYNSCIILLSWLLIPYFLLRPKNVDNLLGYTKIAKHLTTMLGIKWTLRGREHLSKNEACVIVANHQTCLDVLGMFNIWNVINRMTGIAKKELLYLFPGLYLAGTVFIDRNSSKGREAMNEAMEKLKKDNVKLLVFPEGTRRNTGEIHEFKKGAFYSAIKYQVPIVPVVFSSYRHFMDHEKKIFGEGDMIIEALPEISTTGLTVKDIDDLMEQTRQKMKDVYEKISIEAAEKLKV